jgi:hypothetical protein
MSQPSFDPISQQPEEISSVSSSNVKRPLDLYTVMMLISFVAMLAGTIILLIELGQWGNLSELPWNTDGATPNFRS